MRTQITPTQLRHLLAADGYLDLQLPEAALRELRKSANLGPMEGPRMLLMGKALKQMFQHDEAIEVLERAARILPKPVRRIAWRELVECYRSVGSEQLADFAEQLAGEEPLRFSVSLADSEIVLESDSSPC